MKQTNTPAMFPLSRLLLSFVYLICFPLVFFVLAGDWRWIEGWVFVIVFFGGSCATLVYLYFADPALLNERYASPLQKEQKSWDKVLLMLFFLEFLAWFLIMPLDAKRFGWTPIFPFWLRVVGAILFALGFYLMFAALRENTFAAPVVKMQKERGQEVISTGPYANVRHPMYSGALLLFLAGPLLVSSYLGLILGILLTVTIGVRSIGEETMLKEELAGYREYMQRVRWRMIPFVF